MTVTITNSFRQDLSVIMRTELDNAGFDTFGITDDDIPFKYFTVSLRTIQKSPRKIEKAVGFICPANLHNGLARLEECIKKGGALLPFQSKSVGKLTTEDNLLYTWSIHHFHLGDSLDADGFVKRTGPVLFAYVTDDTVYMLDIKQHGAWSNISLLQILHDNWPELIKTWKVPGHPTVSFKSNDIAALRKAHINTIVQLNNGESYLGPGFGITASGSPAEATHKYVDIMHAINSYIQTWEKNPLPLLRVKYSEAEILKMNAVQFDFSLRFVPPNKLEAVDRIHGIVVQMFEQRSFLKDCR